MLVNPYGTVGTEMLYKGRVTCHLFLVVDDEDSTWWGKRKVVRFQNHVMKARK